MSPENKKKLEKIRVKLDKLDNKLLALIKYRTSLVKEVLKLKEFKKEIVDQKRIKFILNKIKGKSKKLKIDPKITNRIWKNMILSYIDYERRNFKKKISKRFQKISKSSKKLPLFSFIPLIFAYKK